MDTLGGTWTDIREHWPEPGTAPRATGGAGPAGTAEES